MSPVLTLTANTPGLDLVHDSDDRDAINRIAAGGPAATDWTTEYAVDVSHQAGRDNKSAQLIRGKTLRSAFYFCKDGMFSINDIIISL